MAIQLSTTVRNARLDAIETAIGTSAIMKIWSGALPANCAAADAGTQLAALTLPSNWMGDAAAGAKALAGTWEDTSADNTGTAVHFRIYDSGGSTCHIQGTVGTSGSDLIVNTTSFVSGRSFQVTAFTLTDANA